MFPLAKPPRYWSANNDEAKRPETRSSPISRCLPFGWDFGVSQVFVPTNYWQLTPSSKCSWRRAKVGMVGILTGLRLPVLVKSVSVSYNGQYMTNKPIHISDDFLAHYVTQNIVLVIFCLEAGLYVSST